MRAYERFLKYVSIDTTSDENASGCPSTKSQKMLGQLLVEEMLSMGISDSRMDEHGYVYGSIPAKGSENKPVIGFIAHMDTSSAVPGGPIKPQIVDYEGGDISIRFKFADEYRRIRITEYIEVNTHAAAI